MWLLDTVAVSESSRPKADAGFLTWLNAVPQNQLHTSILCLGEIRRGILQLGAGKKRDALIEWTRLIPIWFGNRIHAIDQAAADAWGDMVLRGKQSSVDALIGATAKSLGFAVVTRNVRDFDGLGVAVINPWTGA